MKTKWALEYRLGDGVSLEWAHTFQHGDRLFGDTIATLSRCPTETSINRS